MNVPNTQKQARASNNIHRIGSAAQSVVDRLTKSIKDGTYPFDSRLPSERMLAIEFGVARNTVREALDLMQAEGLIRRRAGAGSFVNKIDNIQDLGNDYSLTEDSSPLDILVVRSILEPEIVRLAVVNMTPRQLDELDQTVSKIEAVKTDYNEFNHYEEEFYKLIAQGTANPVLAACYNLAMKAAKQNFRDALLRRHLTPKRIQDYQNRYNVLFNAISSRDVEAAVEFIKLHLVEEQRLLTQPDAGAE